MPSQVVRECVVALQFHVASARAVPKDVALSPLVVVCVLAAVPLVVPNYDSLLSCASFHENIFLVCKSISCCVLLSFGAYPGQGRVQRPRESA